MMRGIIFTFFGISLCVSGGQAPSHATNNSCSLIAKPPLKGESHLLKTSLPSVYNLAEFVCAWDVPAGKYWWYSPLKKGSVNPIYGGASGNATAEVGTGWWLTPPKYFDMTQTKWSSSAWVATRVPAFNHTSCCCQFMSGDLETQRFWLTEYCRAIVPGLDKSPRDTCKPYATPCPADNATAIKQTWPIPPYSERYSACLDPLGTSLPEHGWDMAETASSFDISCDLQLVAGFVGLVALSAAALKFVRCHREKNMKDGLYKPLAAGDDGKMLGA